MRILSLFIWSFPSPHSPKNHSEEVVFIVFLVYVNGWWNRLSLCFSNKSEISDEIYLIAFFNVQSYLGASHKQNGLWYLSGGLGFVGAGTMLTIARQIKWMTWKKERQYSELKKTHITKIQQKRWYYTTGYFFKLKNICLLYFSGRIRTVFRRKSDSPNIISPNYVFCIESYK
jgi:hypothetical protein